MADHNRRGRSRRSAVPAMARSHAVVEPVRRSHAEARRTYDRISRVYDRVEGPFEARARTAGLRQLGVHAGEHVLDIGSGTGHALVALAASAGPGGFVTGADLSPGMQQAARRRIRRAKVGSTVALALADALSLPFRAGSFDAAFMSFVLELFDTPEIPAVLAEAGRILRPGGRLGVVALARGEPPGLVARLYTAGHRRFPRLLDCRPIPTAGLLTQAHFCVDTATTVTMWGLPVDVVTATRPAAGA